MPKGICNTCRHHIVVETDLISNTKCAKSLARYDEKVIRCTEFGSSHEPILLLDQRWEYDKWDGYWTHSGTGEVFKDGKKYKSVDQMTDALEDEKKSRGFSR